MKTITKSKKLKCPKCDKVFNGFARYVGHKHRNLKPIILTT